MRVNSAPFAWLLTAIRILMGAFFLMEAVHQLTSDYIGGDGLEKKLQKGIDTAIPPYDYLIEHVFLKIDDPLTFVVIAGEIGVGVALVLGLLTRFTAVTALAMNVNFFLMNGLHIGSGGVDAAFIVGEMVLIACASQQALSADSRLRRNGVYGWSFSGDAKRDPDY